MSHISFESIRIDTSRIVSHAGPSVRPSHARIVLHWNATAAALLISAGGVWTFAERMAALTPAHSLRGAFAPLILTAIVLAFWWLLLRRGGTHGRVGGMLLGVFCGTRVVAALALGTPLSVLQQLLIYGTVAFLAYAIFGAAKLRVLG